MLLVHSNSNDDDDNDDGNNMQIHANHIAENQV